MAGASHRGRSNAEGITKPGKFGGPFYEQARASNARRKKEVGQRRKHRRRTLQWPSVTRKRRPFGLEQVERPTRPQDTGLPDSDENTQKFHERKFRAFPDGKLRAGGLPRGDNLIRGGVLSEPRNAVFSPFCLSDRG